MSQTLEIKSKNRFDLEQEILECWKVTNDIKLWIEQDATGEDFAVLASYYERKFEQLWNTFEQCVHAKKV